MITQQTTQLAERAVAWPATPDGTYLDLPATVLASGTEVIILRAMDMDDGLTIRVRGTGSTYRIHRTTRLADPISAAISA